MIGKALTPLLVEKGHKVIILSRKGPKKNSEVREHPGLSNEQRIQYETWDVPKGIFPTHVLSGTDYIIHLAGANVGQGRWTSGRKAVIVKSRTDSAALLVKSLRETPNRVKAVISSSATGWYGPDKGRVFREGDPPANDFLGNTCREWESSITPVTILGKRLVILRTGIVLANEGGAFPSFRGPLKAGIAAILGNGKQMVSWIHLHDICRMYLYALENPNLAGPYNAVSPEPVTNQALVLALAGKLKGKFFIPVHVPAFLLKILFGEMSVEVLKSCSVDPGHIRRAGFQYTFPTLEAALNELTRS